MYEIIICTDLKLRYYNTTNTDCSLNLLLLVDKGSVTRANPEKMLIFHYEFIHYLGTYMFRYIN